MSVTVTAFVTGETVISLITRYWKQYAVSNAVYL